MSTHNETELVKAIAYLKERKIYIIEFPFKPTNAAQTDVAATVRRYKQQVQGLPAIKQVRK
jgi:hypothetical protein